MSCPVCKKPTDPNFKPFCSKRCADVDLNRWFSGGPRIAGYGRDITPAEAAANAAPAVLDAVGATVVADLLTEEDLDVLTTPWRALWDEP